MKFKVIEGVSGQTGFSFHKKKYMFKNGFFETDNKEIIEYLSNLGKYKFCEPIIERPVGEPIEETLSGEVIFDEPMIEDTVVIEKKTRRRGIKNGND